MSLPKKKRGFRRIIVDDVAYDWRCDQGIDIRRTDYPRHSLLLDGVFEDPWLQISETRLQRNSSPITPAFIAYAIQEIVKLGWEPKECISCIAQYESGQFTLKEKVPNSHK